MPEDVFPCKTMLTVNVMAVKAANTCLSPGAHEVLVHAHFKTLLTTMGMQALFVINSVKLHLTALKSLLLALICNLQTFSCYKAKLGLGLNFCVTTK